MLREERSVRVCFWFRSGWDLAVVFFGTLTTFEVSIVAIVMPVELRNLDLLVN